MSNFEMMNTIPELDVETATKVLSKMYVNYILSETPLKKVPAVMLWGPPGVGKSQAVSEMSNEIELSTGKTVNVTDVRLLLFNPIDLRGIPVADANREFSVWLKPKIFDMKESDDTINILFLDEISAAPPSVQAAAYQITLDRVIGEHELPDNCIVICAGNRTSDKSVAYKMPKALANRLMHIGIEPSFESWEKWAVKNGISAKIIGFLSARNDMLIKREIETDEVAYTTPRSWEKVSDILNYVDENIDSVYPLISGTIGSGAALEFRSWCNVYTKLPNTKDIFAGKVSEVPKSADCLYAITASMIEYARHHKDDYSLIVNAIKYANKMPADFSAVFMKDLMYIEPNYRKKLIQLPEFSKWLSEKGRMLNGSV